jgi:hypothetical protein
MTGLKEGYGHSLARGRDMGPKLENPLALRQRGFLMGFEFGLNP